jgi:hypothetical protein
MTIYLLIWLASCKQNDCDKSGFEFYAKEASAVAHYQSISTPAEKRLFKLKLSRYTYDSEVIELSVEPTNGYKISEKDDYPIKGRND